MNPQSLAGLTILLVEDDAGSRVAITRFLTFDGATVREASSAEAGLELFKAEVPQIVIADISLPLRDGMWLLGQIRALAVGGRVPVIALTGRVLSEEIEHVRAAGFDGHLEKPVDLYDMEAAIAMLTGRS